MQTFISSAKITDKPSIDRELFRTALPHANQNKHSKNEPIWSYSKEARTICKTDYFPNDRPRQILTVAERKKKNQHG